MAKPIPTTAANIALIESFFATVENTFMNLYSRWQDEKGHEDIKDYADVVRKSLPAGWTGCGMTGRPFAFTFSIGTEAKYQIYATSKQYGWKRIA